MFECELKYWPVDRSQLSSRLKKLGKLVFSAPVQNIYFTFSGTGEDYLFRVRSVGPACFLTAKGPRLQADTKKRLEFESEVGGFSEAAQLFEFAGGVRVGSVEERWREKWSLINGVSLVIDRLADLRVPEYVEIESCDGKRILEAAEAMKLDKAQSGALTFEELALQFGVSFDDLLQPLPDAIRKNRDVYYPEAARLFGEGRIRKTVFFRAPFGIIEVKHFDKGGSVFFGNAELQVKSPHLLVKALLLAGLSGMEYL